ncbi:MAG TPA: c-type cytochrome, partial [Humisphaera sp.]
MPVTKRQAPSVVAAVRAAARRALAPRASLVALALAAPLLTGCNIRQIIGLDMHNQPKARPYRASEFFEDGSSARMQVNGTVPRRDPVPDRAGHAVEPVKYAGEMFPPGFPSGPNDADKLRATLARGQTVYNVNCSVCHGQSGLGDGMIPQRGFPQPPSFVFPKEFDAEKFKAVRDQMTPGNRQRWERTLWLNEQAPPSHFVHAIANGWGAMYSYNERVAEPD